jgi:hypothetical protein
MEVSWPDGRQQAGRNSVIDGGSGRIGRGRSVLTLAGDCPCTYGGIFRTDVARRGRPLRRHLAGEFAADWPFLQHFAFQGEVIRVPELLYCKRDRRTGVSSTWRHGTLPGMGAALCCGRILLDADLLSRERLALLSYLGWRMTRGLGRAVIGLAPRVVHRMVHYLQQHVRLMVCSGT